MSAFGIVSRCHAARDGGGSWHGFLPFLTCRARLPYPARSEFGCYTPHPNMRGASGKGRARSLCPDRATRKQWHTGIPMAASPCFRQRPRPPGPPLPGLGLDTGRWSIRPPPSSRRQRRSRFGASRLSSRGWPVFFSRVCHRNQPAPRSHFRIQRCHRSTMRSPRPPNLWFCPSSRPHRCAEKPWPAPAAPFCAQCA